MKVALYRGYSHRERHQASTLSILMRKASSGLNQMASWSSLPPTLTPFKPVYWLPYKSPLQGILSTKWSFIRSSWAALNPLISSGTPYYMTFPQFQYAFANTLPLAEQKAAYDAEVVPESRRLQRGALSSLASVDFTRRRAPLLFIAGEKDHIIPSSLNRANYERYKGSPSVTEFKEFPGGPLPALNLIRLD